MGAPHFHLRALVRELFATNTAHLRSVLADLPGGGRLLEQLPERAASPSEFIDHALDELQRHGLVDAALKQLGEEFPIRRREIERIAADVHSHARDAHDDDIQDYLARVRERCRFVNLVGLGSPLQVQVPIDGFYVPLRLYLSRSLEGREVPGRFDPDELGRGELVAKDVPLEDVLRTAGRFGLRGVVLLGDAGSGKTTAARYIAWRIAHGGGEPFGLAPGTVPMLLSFRHCRPEFLMTGLATWCSQEWSSPHAPELQELGRRLVAHGPVLWILDGLDEIASASGRVAASQWIHQALLDRPDDSFLISSRYAGYAGEPLLRESFLELHLQPLDVAQSQAFIRRWYHCVESVVRGADPAAMTIAEQHSEGLIASLEGRDLRHQLGAVATNPLLLSILCLAHRRSAGASLRRASLYRQCVDVLLGHWQSSKSLTAPGHDAAYALLRKLAWVLHRTGTRTELSVEDAAALLSDEDQALLRCIRDECGLVVTSRPGHHGFLHLTFQEFFAALHVEAQGAAASLVGHFEEPWWREVVVLFSGLAAPASMHEFVAGLLQTHALESQPDLFAQCLDAAEPFPLEALLEQLAQAPEIGLLRLRGLLRLLRDQDSPRLRGLCEGLLQHEDGGVVGLAKEILARSDGQPRIDVVAPPEVTARPGPGGARVRGDSRRRGDDRRHGGAHQ